MSTWRRFSGNFSTRAQWARAPALQRLHQVRRLTVAVRLAGLFQTDGLMAALPAQGINGLVGSNSVKPGSHRPPGLELPALLIHLKEGVLKNVLGEGVVAEVTLQVAVEFTLVTAQQYPKRLGHPATEASEQFLVGTQTESVRKFHSGPVIATQRTPREFESRRTAASQFVRKCQSLSSG